jgi:hypothetical protein
MSYDDGSVIVYAEGGRFVWAGGTIVWEAAGATGTAPMAAAPAAALYALCIFFVDMAWLAASGCGAGAVGGALASVGWAVLTGNYIVVSGDLIFLAECVIAGGMYPLPD